MKPSLHPTKWRMAFTEKAAAQHLPADADRVVSRWDKPGDIAPGWKHAASIIVLMSNLGPAFPEKRMRRGVQVAWLAATRPGPASGST